MIVFVSLGLACAGAVAIVAYKVGNLIDEPPERFAKAGVRTLETAVRAHKIMHGDHPEKLSAVTEPIDGKPPSLEPSALIDPWGRKYVYDRSQRHPESGVPLIYSTGPDPDNEAGHIRNWK